MAALLRPARWLSAPQRPRTSTLPAPPRGRRAGLTPFSVCVPLEPGLLPVEFRPLPGLPVCSSAVLPGARAGSCLSLYPAPFFPAPGPGVPRASATSMSRRGGVWGGGLDRLPECWQGMLPAWVLTFAVSHLVYLPSGYGQPRKLRGSFEGCCWGSSVT